jgi:hypothetical protein
VRHSTRVSVTVQEVIVTRPSQVSPSLLIPAVVSCGLAACVSNTAVAFTSKVNLAHAAPIDGMLVTNVQNSGLDAELYRGFEIGLTQRLGSCGVRARVLHGRAAQLDPTPEAVKAIQAVAVMSIELASPPLIRAVGFSSSRVSAVFALKLEDIASRQTTWVARSKLEFRLLYTHADAEFGAWFATQVVSRLRDDGVLTGCPATAAGWPAVDLPPDPAAPVQPIEPSSL